MLLRSSSAPIPSSWLPHSLGSEFILNLPRTRSSVSCCLSQPLLSESDLHISRKKKNKKNCLPPLNNVSRNNQERNNIRECCQVEQEETSSSSIRELFSCTGLDHEVVKMEAGGDDERKRYNSVVQQQSLVLGGGGKGCDGGHRNKWDYYSEGGGNTNAYYQKMIEANPGNALFLGNYARFLKEVS